MTTNRGQAKRDEINRILADVHERNMQEKKRYEFILAGADKKYPRSPTEPILTSSMGDARLTRGYKQWQNETEKGGTKHF